MKKLFPSAIAAALGLFGTSSSPGNLFGRLDGRTPNRYHTRQSNSTEITNHNAAIDAAKAEKKARKGRP